MNTPAVRVLMIDDNEDDYILARDLLTDGGGFTVSWAATSNGGLAALAANAHDVCLLDYRMGSADGLTLFQKALDAGLAMPVVFLTGAGDEAVDLAAVRSGAADYLAKSELSPALLRRVIRHAIERGKILSTLRASEAKFRAVFEDSSIGIALLDAGGAIRDVNPCFLETFRAGEAALKGRPFVDLAHPGDNAAVAAVLDDFSRRAGKCSQLESRFLTADGKALWARLLLSALPYLDNTDIAAVAMVQDITAHKQAEEERARLALFPERNPNPVVRLSAEGMVEFANAAAAPLLRAWGCAVGERAPEHLRRAVQEVYAGKAPRDIEVSWEGRIFSVALQPVNGDGFVYLYGREVTEARRAEEDLRMAAMVFEHTADAVMVTSPDGVILSVNRAFTAITGYLPEEMVGKKPNLLKSQHHDAAFYERMWNALLTEGWWDGEIWNRRKNGAVYPAMLSIRAVRGPGGAVLKYFSVLRDITDLKRNEREINYRAYHDPLTGLPNRLLFKDRLSRALLLARRVKATTALLYLDLDGFKGINDTLGHHAGDLLLQGVAMRLSGAVRDEDTVARLAGDEFTIILERVASRRNVEEIAERVREAVTGEFDYHGALISVTASIGAALCPEDTEELDPLIKRADGAMYAAKQRGKNAVVFYGDIAGLEQG